MLGEELKLWNSPQRWKCRRGERGVDGCICGYWHPLPCHLLRAPSVRISPTLHRATPNGRCPPTLSITTTRCRYCGEVGLTVAALMLLVLLVLFTLLGEDLLLGAARRVSLLPDQVEHSLSHPRVLGEHQLYNLRHSRWMMYLEEYLDNFYFKHRVAVASILVNKDYTELTLHLLQATFFGFSKTQIPENISR